MNIKKHIRLIAGIVALLIGVTFFIVPVIPVLGVAGLFAGAFLLAPYIPVLNKFKEWLKQKDSSGRTQQTEQKMEELERKYGEQEVNQKKGRTGDARNNMNQSEQEINDLEKRNGQKEGKRSNDTNEVDSEEENQERPPYEKKEKER